MGSIKLWFSLFNVSGQYKGSETGFVSLDAFEWVQVFQENSQGLKDEIAAFLSQNNTPNPYFKKEMVTQDLGYRTLSLRWWDLNFRKNKNQFPLAYKLMEQFPQISTLSYNFLAPGASIKPHFGDTNAIYRCHFGLQIPAEFPECGIKVNGENNSWKEGAFIGFIDAFEHETFNHSKSERIIILMDVIRPDFIRKRAWITTVVMTSMFLQKRAVKLPFIYRAPQWLITLSAIMLLPFAYLSVKFLNIIRYY